MSHLSSEATSASQIPKFSTASRELVPSLQGFRPQELWEVIQMDPSGCVLVPEPLCTPRPPSSFHIVSSRSCWNALSQAPTLQTPYTHHIFAHTPPSRGLPWPSNLKLHLCPSPGPDLHFLSPVHLTAFSNYLLVFTVRCLSPLLDWPHCEGKDLRFVHWCRWSV